MKKFTLVLAVVGVFAFAHDASAFGGRVCCVLHRVRARVVCVEHRVSNAVHGYCHHGHCHK